MRMVVSVYMCACVFMQVCVCECVCVIEWERKKSPLIFLHSLSDTSTWNIPFLILKCFASSILSSINLFLLSLSLFSSFSFSSLGACFPTYCSNNSIVYLSYYLIFIHAHEHGNLFFSSLYCSMPSKVCRCWLLFRNRFRRFHWKYFEILLGCFEDRVSHSYKIVTSSNIRSYNPQARCRFQCHTIGERGLVLLQFTAKEHSIPQQRHTPSTRMPRMGWRACVHRFLATKKYLPRRCCRDGRSRVCSTTIYRVNERFKEKLPKNNFQKCL